MNPTSASSAPLKAFAKARSVGLERKLRCGSCGNQQDNTLSVTIISAVFSSSALN
jgi:hypothetical protein